MRQNNQY